MVGCLVVLILLLWIAGLLGHVGGGLIHLLLLIALIVIVWDFISARRL